MPFAPGMPACRYLAALPGTERVFTDNLGRLSSYTEPEALDACGISFMCLHASVDALVLMHEDTCRTLS